MAMHLRAAGRSVERVESPASLSLRANLDRARLLDLDPNGTAFRLGLRRGDVLVHVNAVDVASSRDVRRAWSSPVDGRIRVVYRRAGEEHRIDVEVPTSVRYVLDPTEWEHEA